MRVRGLLSPKVWKFAALVVVVALAATSAFATTTGNDLNRGVIMFVGDSNVSRSGYWTVKILTAGVHVNNNYVPVFVARYGSGIRTEDCLDPDGCTTNDFWQTKLATTFTSITPSAIVIDLGINDAAIVGTPTSQGYSSYGAKIDWMMSQLPNVPVLWTNFPCRIEPAGLLTGCRVVNPALLDARSRWPKLTIVDWGDLANKHPEWIDRTSPDVTSRVHYTDAGYKALAQIETTALDAIFPPL